MARAHVMVWTGALLAACLAAAAVAANCGSRCTDTTFRAYASCLQNCGADVAVTTCDCSAMACTRCPGDNSCCQTCCNLKQCECSNVNCQQPCTSACCAKCCQPPVETPQCGNCASGCQQQGSACSPCCQTTTTTTTTSRPPPDHTWPPPPQQGPIYVNVSVPAQPPSIVNVSLGNIPVQPTNITLMPANISFTPNITVIVNTSPVSQVYPTQYAGNVSLILQQGGPTINCTAGRRRCCRVVMAPSAPCPPGYSCPPVERYACGDQCSTIVLQPVYIQPRPTYYYYYYYPVYRPVYVYVPQPPQYFCSSGCMPTQTWPFARCFDATPTPYSAGAASVPQYFQPYASLEAAPDAAAAAAAAATADNLQG